MCGVCSCDVKMFEGRRRLGNGWAAIGQEFNDGDDEVRRGWRRLCCAPYLVALH